MASNLWQFAFERSSSKYTLPTITSPNGNTYQNISQFAGSGGGGGDIVNVLNGFLWTNSKKRAGDTGRDQAPYVRLKERRLKVNSLVAQALYSAGGAADGAKDLARLFGISSSTNPVDVGKLTTELFTKIAGGLGKAISAFSKTELAKRSGLGSTSINSESLADRIRGELEAVIGDDPNFLNQNYLHWYRGLYITEPTGWQFVLPYFEDYNQNAANNWGSSSDTTIAGGFLASNILGFTQGAQSLVNDIGGFGIGLGTYVENSQYYQYSKTGESITLKFPLINTGSATYEDVVRNWQFIFLLLYNNKPERINRNLIEPPPLYEVTIPGVKYMPFSYISSLGVTYKGTRRMMKINVPASIKSGGGISNITTNFQTIVPEAYEITITLQGLVTDSKNFMYSLVNDQPVKVDDIKNKLIQAGLNNIIPDNVRDIVERVRNAS